MITFKSEAFKDDSIPIGIFWGVREVWLPRLFTHWKQESVTVQIQGSVKAIRNTIYRCSRSSTKRSEVTVVLREVLPARSLRFAA